MKFLIWFVYLAIASILNSLLLSLVDTSASLQGVMLFSFFITVAVYGAVIFFAKTTCNWYAKKKNKCTPMQFVPSTRITQVPTSQEIVEVYRQPKNRVAPFPPDRYYSGSHFLFDLPSVHRIFRLVVVVRKE